MDLGRAGKPLAVLWRPDHRREILTEGPYGESAEALIVVDVELRQPRLTGTKIADDLAARGYNGP
jgi:hypothetical protein